MEEARAERPLNREEGWGAGALLGTARPPQRLSLFEPPVASRAFPPLPLMSTQLLGARAEGPQEMRIHFALGPSIPHLNTCPLQVPRASLRHGSLMHGTSEYSPFPWYCLSA